MCIRDSTHTIRNPTAAFFLFGGSSWILVIEETVDVRTCAFFATTYPVNGLNAGTSRSGIRRFTVTSIDLGMVPIGGIQHGTGPSIVVVRVVAMGTAGPVSVTEFFGDHVMSIGVSPMGDKTHGAGTRDAVVGGVAVTDPATLNLTIETGLVE